VKRYFIAFFCLLTSFSGISAENTVVSVLTCSPGEEVHALFGHTGLRFRDDSAGMDVVFSYGYFDFGSPNFVWRFILGETDYMVGAVPYRHFMQEYEERGSAVVEQQLNLTPLQQQTLYRALVENCRPENRVYRYNYFYNNCTTRIRDLLYSVAGEVSYEGETPNELTFREALSMFTGRSPWYAFGIDLLLGADIDKPASRHQLQFIPGFFMNDADRAYVTAADGSTHAFVKEKGVLLPGQQNVVPKDHLTPFNVSLLLLLATMIVILCEVRRKKTYWGLDVVLMLLQGVPGLLLLFMALFSSHPAVGNNWLLILFNPLALVLMPIMVYRAIKKSQMGVSWLQVALVVLFFLSAVFSLQVYPVPVYFFAIALMARALFHIYKKKICELNLY
jgi:hypothetical protein